MAEGAHLPRRERPGGQGAHAGQIVKTDEKRVVKTHII